MFDGFDVPSMGRVLSWVPANPENGDQALWHVHHNDGDEEDLDEAEMKAALRLAAKVARKAKQGQQRAREQQQQLLLQQQKQKQQRARKKLQKQQQQQVKKRKKT